ncbi:MAG: hypothetical protein ACLTZT_05920 [Butyricimonas faecalis]
MERGVGYLLKDTKTPIDVYRYYPEFSGSISEYAFEVQKDQAKAGAMGIWEAMRRVIFFGERRRRWNLQRSDLFGFPS